MSMEFWDGKDIKKTKAVHKCFLCRIDIPTGNPCFYDKGKYDGDFFSRHSHHECMTAWQKLNKDTGYDEDWGDLDDMDNFKEHKQFIINKYGGNS